MPTKPHSFETILTRAWLRRGFLACLLWPLSLLFRALVGARRGLYKTGILQSTRLPVPVIVVGNIFIGGTGKTPLTIWLVNALRHAGYVPGVISRGYGGGSAAARPVRADSTAQEAGDEPILIARHAHCPVVVGADRVASAKALLVAHPEVNLLISDDGLQHYAMRRDVEIVLFDARGVGNGWMLPAGPLREPVCRAADFVVVNASSLPASVPAESIRMQLLGDSAERLVDRSQRVSLTAKQNFPGVDHGSARIVAAAGIGHPARFFSMLRALGLQFDEIALPDHYDFLLDPFAGLQADVILITEKDAVKCVQMDHFKNDQRLWVVPVVASIDGALAEQIVEKLRGQSTA